MNALARLGRKVGRAVLNRDASFCDMYADPGSRITAADYLDLIRPRLRERFGDRRLTIVDAGCQAGRLLIPLGELGHTMIGIEPSGFALRRAKQHMRRATVSGQLHRGSALHVRRWVPAESADVLVCAEVLYLCRDSREILQALVETVRPGGLLFISHRPARYYALRMLRERGVDAALELLQRSEGPTTEGGYFNWHTETSLRDLYRSVGLRWLSAHPVVHERVTIPREAFERDELARLFEGLRPDTQYELEKYVLICAER